MNEYQKRYIKTFEDAREEALRFARRAADAIETLKTENIDNTKTAAAKRTSMDLSRALSKVRKGMWAE